MFPTGFDDEFDKKIEALDEIEERDEEFILDRDQEK